MVRTSLVSCVAVCVLVFGCKPAPKTDPKTLFEQTVKQYHLPSAEAKGAERDQLLTKADDGYTQLLKQHPDQPFWCAQAQRSLANVRASQGRFDDAVKLYAGVAERWPEQEWEVLQSWKSVADLLWDADRQTEAKQFYERIVARFNDGTQPQVMKVVVEAAKRRLSGTGPVSARTPEPARQAPSR
jgi:tetratricopeptide (TPR) repeat protein